MTKKIYVIVDMHQGMVDTVNVYWTPPIPLDTSDEYWDNGHKTFGPYVLADLQDAPINMHKCQSCIWVGPETQLGDIKDLLKRVGPGEIMPSGECPQCGALCHPVDVEEDD